MIKLKSQDGSVHLQMQGDFVIVCADMCSALDAIMTEFNNHDMETYGKMFRQVIKAWAEGEFDD